MLGAVILLRTQEAYLVDQVDEQLEAARPLVAVRAAAPPPPDRPASIPQSDERPISEPLPRDGRRRRVGDVHPGPAPRRLTRDRRRSGTELQRTNDESPFTVDGQQGSSALSRRRRPARPGQTMSVIALPLDEVDDAMRRLRWTLAAGIFLIAGSPARCDVVGSPPRFASDRAPSPTRPTPSPRRPRASRRRSEPAHRGRQARHRVQRHARRARRERGTAAAVRRRRLPRTAHTADVDSWLSRSVSRGWLPCRGRTRRDGSSHEPRVQPHDRTRRGPAAARQARPAPSAAPKNESTSELLCATRQPTPRCCSRSAASSSRSTRTSRSRRLATPIAFSRSIGALVTNALVHTDTATGLTLSVRAMPEGIEVVVADDGPGLQPADAARVFDRFFRGDQSRARRTGGSGLGPRDRKVDRRSARRHDHASHRARPGLPVRHRAPGAGAMPRR